MSAVTYRSLKRRLVGALAFTVAVPVLAVYGYLFVLNLVGFDVLWMLTGDRLYGHVYVKPWVVAGFAVGFLALATIGYRLRLRAAMAVVEPTSVTRAERPALVDRVSGLATAVGVDAPTVATTDIDVPTAFTVGVDPRTHTLVVSDDLQERLDDDELNAVLAHELAHQRNVDQPATVAAVAVLSVLRPLAAPTVAGRTVELMLGFGVTKHPIVRKTVSVVFFPVTLCVLPTYLGVRFVFDHSFARYREYVADTAAGAIVEDHAALADALETLDEWDGDAPSDGFLDAFAIVPFDDPSNETRRGPQPSTSERVDRLRALAGDA